MLKRNAPEPHPLTPSPFDPLTWIVCVVLLSAVVFAAVAPTLRWLEFSNSAESLNVATAQEILRTDNWLIPTLQDKVRSTKPPLTAWVTALAISDGTMRDISSADATTRAHAFADLAWEVRWPALLAACLTLICIAEIGRLIGGPTCGILSLVACSTCLIFLRFCRYSTTDVQLMLWVSAGNMFLLYALLNGRVWVGYIGAGIALGIAMMSKGPVGLIQSILPVAVYAIYHRPKQLKIVPLLCGVVAFLVVGLSWYGLVAWRDSSIMEIWWREVTRRGATEGEPDKWYSYLSLIPYMSPWMVFLAIGGFFAIKTRGQQLLPLVLLLLPLAIMTLAKDRNERYLLPLIPAAAVVVGVGLVSIAQRGIPAIIHWIILGFIAVGFPVAMMLVNPPWFTPKIAIPAAVICAIMLALGIMLQTHRPRALVVTTFLIMLGLQSLFIDGYRETPKGRADLRPFAEKIADQYPDAEIFNAHPRGKRPPPELGVYLNRVLRWTEDPGSIPPGDKPKLLLMIEDRGNPHPTPPAGWDFVLKDKRDKDWWWAFVLPAK